MADAPKRRDIVLVVDDAPDTLSFLTDTLEGAGVTVLIATDGASCLELVDQITPHLILRGAMMPGLDGFETCRRLKQEKALQHVPVIFMTGLSDTEHVLEGLQAGGVDYVAKPIVVEELLARIRVHLANARVTSGSQMALDATGRFLLAIDGTGTPLWCTPRAEQLLAEVFGGEAREEEGAREGAPAAEERVESPRRTAGLLRRDGEAADGRGGDGRVQEGEWRR